MSQAMWVFGPTVAMLVPGLMLYLCMLVWQAIHRLRSRS